MTLCRLVYIDHPSFQVIKSIALIKVAQHPDVLTFEMNGTSYPALTRPGAFERFEYFMNFFTKKFL